MRRPSHKQCTYHLVECTKEHGGDKCNKCVEFLCEKIQSILKRSKEYQKSVNSSYKETSLLKYLVGKKVKTVAVVGLQTDYCIDATIK